MNDDGWVEITKRYRLWASVPDHERVTEADIKRRYAAWQNPHYRDIYLEQLRNPQCEIANKTDEYGRGKWKPCSGQVHGDGKRCKLHGGPSKKTSSQRKPYRVLEAEVEELKKRLAEKP